MSLMSAVFRHPFFGGPIFGAIGRNVIAPMDRVIHRLSGGRWGVSPGFGIPLMFLTTVGRKTGTVYRTPLTFAENGDVVWVAGSNWGQEHHPAWALNLTATPDTEIEIHGQRRLVRARVLEGEARLAAWDAMMKVWPHYDRYDLRSGQRDIMIFQLDPR